MSHQISIAYLKKIAQRVHVAVRNSSKINKSVFYPTVKTNMEKPEDLYMEIVNGIRYLEAPYLSHLEFRNTSKRIN